MLLVKKTLTAFATDQNRSQWFNTDKFTSCVATPMLLLKSNCVCTGVGGFPSWVALLKDSESFLLCTWPPSTKRSKDALGVSFIQASWKGKAHGRLRRQVISDRAVSNTHHFHLQFIGQNTVTECQLMKGQMGNAAQLDAKEMSWVSTNWSLSISKKNLDKST